MPSAWLERDAELHRQRAWAQQTDTRLAGVAEHMTIAGEGVARTAGETFCILLSLFFCSLHLQILPAATRLEPTLLRKLTVAIEGLQLQI